MALVDIHNNSGFIDRTAGVRQLIDLLPTLENATCLDLFAGDGSFCSNILADAVDKITCIAYDDEAAHKIKKNIPSAHIVVADALDVTSVVNPVDIVFCDNPQGILPNGTCEYFDYLKHIVSLVSSGGYVVHNVNVLPYNYDENSLWAKRRNEFYQLPSCDHLSLEYVERFHKEYVETTLQRKVHSIKLIPREKYKNNTYLYFLVYKIS